MLHTRPVQKEAMVGLILALIWEAQFWAQYCRGHFFRRRGIRIIAFEQPRLSMTEYKKHKIVRKKAYAKPKGSVQDLQFESDMKSFDVSRFAKYHNWYRVVRYLDCDMPFEDKCRPGFVNAINVAVLNKPQNYCISFNEPPDNPKIFWWFNGFSDSSIRAWIETELLETRQKSWLFGKCADIIYKLKRTNERAIQELHKQIGISDLVILISTYFIND